MRFSIFCITFLLGLMGYCENLYRSQDSIILKSDKLPSDFSLYFPQSFEEISLSPSKGITLSAVHFKVKNPKGVILYFHGRGGNIQTLWGQFASEFIHRGYDVIMPDYRGFGKSSGILTEATLYQDAELFYTYATSLYKEDHIVIYGRSFGTGVATDLASKHSPSRLILESPYTSLVDVAVSSKPYFPKWLIENTLKYHLNSSDKIHRVTCPITLFHGILDDTIPYEQSLQLAKLAQQNNPRVECILLDKATHNSVCYHLAYRQKLSEVLS